MDKIIFFVILSLFPFGQIFKIGIFNLFDLFVVLLAVVTILKKPKFPEWYKYFLYFILACIFSLLLNYSVAESQKLVDIKSILYLMRLVSYSFVAVYIFNFYHSYKSVTYNLLAVALTSAIFGWLQYLIWPDLTYLKYLGWDDHLLRMTGTFLDPTYLGLIFVLGIIIALDKFPKIVYFLLFSLAFTYSRASYLAISIVLLLKQKYLPLLFFVLIILFLPKNIGEGTNLARTVSGNDKLINYQETIQIIKKSPVYGVGFNNICNARILYLNDTNLDSHSCNGADSSILFLLATTGIVGLILFISFVLQITSLPYSTYYMLLTTSFMVVFVHSLFANSMFYPHIMFWMFVLIGLQTKVDSQRS